MNNEMQPLVTAIPSSITSLPNEAPSYIKLISKGKRLLLLGVALSIPCILLNAVPTLPLVMVGIGAFWWIEGFIEKRHVTKDNSLPAPTSFEIVHGTAPVSAHKPLSMNASTARVILIVFIVLISIDGLGLILPNGGDFVGFIILPAILIGIVLVWPLFKIVQQIVKRESRTAGFEKLGLYFLLLLFLCLAYFGSGLFHKYF